MSAAYNRSVVLQVNRRERGWLGPYGRVIVLVLVLLSGTQPVVGAIDEPLAPGLALLARGDFDQAAVRLGAAVQAYKNSGDLDRQFDALLYLSQAHQALGQHKNALATLTGALAIAERTGNRDRLLAAKNALGTVHTLLRQWDAAQIYLEESLALANQDRPETKASVLNNLAIWFAVQGKYPEALERFHQAARTAVQSGDTLNAARGFANAALFAIQEGKLDPARSWNDEAWKRVEALAPTFEQANLYTLLGLNWQKIIRQRPDARVELLPRAQRAFNAADAVGDKIGSARARSSSAGHLGNLYELEGRTDEALRLTRKALFLANQVGAADAAYQWESQLGRLLKSAGQPEAAIAAYRRALETFQGLRHDLALGHGNQPAEVPFDEGAGAAFFELADLLLRKTETLVDPGEIQDCLQESLRTIELMRSAELEDYLQDECISLQRARTAHIAGISARTAVIYIIPFKERFDLLLGLASGANQFRLQRHSLPVAKAELRETSDRLRRLLEKRTTNEYFETARRLYDWLIAPIAATLIAERIDTLVIIAGEPLRTVPIAALNTIVAAGKREFLVERYAVAVSPGLTLMDPKPTPRANVSLLIGALSKPVRGMRALKYVPTEVTNIHRIFSSRVLMDHDFVTEKVTDVFTQGRYAIFHIASHGQFDHEAKNSYIVTYDGQLDLNDLERMIRPKQFHGQPVELLALSACETAAGDHRAALGLAGVAVKSGARSALATLWRVNDQTSSILISEFYSRLRKDPSLSKARALQAAQVHLLENTAYKHPGYWAPYLIIGNWL